MEEIRSGSLAVTQKEKAVKSLLKIEPNLHSLAEIHFKYVSNVDSSDMSPSCWEKIAQTIYDQYDEFDGFVLTHGTDTMAYTSSALTFLLQDLGKPVVLTGSQIPGYKIGNDARRNIISAVKVATTDLAGVYIVFGEDVVLGCRASKISESALNAFESINDSKVATIRVRMMIHKKHKCRHHRPLKLCFGFDRQIFVSSIVPGTDHLIYQRLLEGGVKGFILKGFGTGNVPAELLSFIKKAQKKEIPVVLSSQCSEGRTSMSKYKSGAEALAYGVIESFDMSLEATTVKLMWLLGQKISYDKLLSCMHENMFGEVNSSPNYVTFDV